METQQQRTARSLLLLGFALLYLIFGRTAHLSHNPWFPLSHYPADCTVTADGYHFENATHHAATGTEQGELAAILRALPLHAFSPNIQHAGITPSFGVTIHFPLISVQLNECGPTTMELNLPGGAQWWVEDAALARWCGRMCGVDEGYYG